MIEAQPAIFSFKEFKVPQFSYNEANQSDSNLKLGFKPSGRYESSTGIFELKIMFIASVDKEEGETIFDLTSVATFQFESAPILEDIPSYFYKNSIAIVFPYIRAFISTLTLQANTRLLRLGLMNLSNLEKPLIENTIAV